MSRRSSISITILYFFIALLAMLFLAPMVLSIMVSLTDEDAINRNGYSFVPEKLSLYSYQLIFQSGSSVLRSYLVSVFVTITGTCTAVLISVTAAYTLSNRSIQYRGKLALFIYVPMVFTSGIVPWYLICTRIGLKNNLLALIVPSLVFNPFNLFLIRNYMSGIPESLRESAKIDGTGDMRILFQIYFPLSVPIIATVCLFYGLAYWNDWWNAIMLVDNNKLYPLQFMLLQLKSRIQMIRDLQLTHSGVSMTPPSESLKMATSIVTIGPIVLLYPFVQRYFIKGLVIGSIKG